MAADMDMPEQAGAMYAASGGAAEPAMAPAMEMASARSSMPAAAARGESLSFKSGNLGSRMQTNLPPMKESDVPDRMIIRTASLTIEVKQVSPLLQEVADEVNKVKGFIESSSVSSNNNHMYWKGSPTEKLQQTEDNDYDSATIVLKVPPEHYDEFLQWARNKALKVLYESANGE